MTPATVLYADEIRAATNHDIYDWFYLALAREADLDVLLTTDRGFEALEGISYAPRRTAQAERSCQ